MLDNIKRLHKDSSKRVLKNGRVVIRSEAADLVTVRSLDDERMADLRRAGYNDKQIVRMGDLFNPDKTDPENVY